MRQLIILSLLLLFLVPTASATNFVYTSFSFPMFESTGGAYNVNTGKLWFHEHYQGRMHEFNIDGTPTGNVVNTPGDPDVHGLAYNHMTDRFWLSEAGASNVIEFTPAGGETRRWTAPTTDQTGLAVDNNTGNIYWTSWTSTTIYEFTEDGFLLRTFGVVQNPLSLEHHPQANTLLVTDNNDVLTEMNLDGTVANTWDISGLVGGRSVRIRATAFDALNCRFYLANEDDGRVYELQDLDCGATAVEPATWGVIKSTFR